jgi:ketosteroid isomerase-like protein
MSQENVEVVVQAVDAWCRGDLEALLANYDPAVKLDWSRSDGPLNGTYTGHDGIREWWNLFREVFDEISSEPLDFIPADPHVVVPMTTRFRGRHGIEVVARGTVVYTVSAGQIIYAGLYQQLAEALEAVGLRE